MDPKIVSVKKEIPISPINTDNSSEKDTKVKDEKVSVFWRRVHVVTYYLKQLFHYVSVPFVALRNRVIRIFNLSPKDGSTFTPPSRDIAGDSSTPPRSRETPKLLLNSNSCLKPDSASASASASASSLNPDVYENCKTFQ